MNSDRFNHFAKKELAKGKLEEAKKLYEKAIQVALRDGRAYLGLSKVAQRRRDFKYAKDYPKTGIANGFGDGTLVTRLLTPMVIHSYFKPLELWEILA